MFVYAFACDICGTPETATPTEGYWSYRLPKGWRAIDGRQCCSLPCVARYASDPDAFPRQQLAPDPFTEGLRKAFDKREKVPDAAPVT